MGWTFLATRGQLRASVVEVFTTGFGYSRALHQIERRRIEIVFAPSKSSGDELGPPPDPAGLDPWTVDEKTLPTSTERLCPCPQCHGRRKVDCACRGTKIRTCEECDGTGSVPGKRAATKKCPSCRGRRTKKCTACDGLLARCERCLGSGQLRAWLEVRRRFVTQVMANPPSVASHHARLLDEHDFDSQSWPFELVADRSVGPDEDLDPKLAADIDHATDRVVTSRVQTFDASGVTLRHATALGQEALSFSGDGARFLARPAMKPWVARRVVLLTTAGAGLFIALVVWIAHITRHEFFAKYGHGALAFWATAAAGLAITAFFGQRTLVRAARHKWLGLASLLAAGATGLVAASSFAFAPTVAHAQKAVDLGDLPGATIEARALIERGIDVGGGQVVLDAVATTELDRASGLAERATIARRQWHSPVLGARAASNVASQGRAAARTAFDKGAAGELNDVRNAVGGIDRDLDRELDALAELLIARDALERGQLDAVSAPLQRASANIAVKEDRERLVGRFVAALQSALDTVVAEARNARLPARSRANKFDRALMLVGLAGSYDQNGLGQSVAALRAERDKALAVAVIEETAAAEAAAARRAAEDRRAAAEAAREASRPLLCCDGSPSPSCLCGGNHRGCCSWHGGVCGCVGK